MTLVVLIPLNMGFPIYQNSIENSLKAITCILCQSFHLLGQLMRIDFVIYSRFKSKKYYFIFDLTSQVLKNKINYGKYLEG